MFTIDRDALVLAVGRVKAAAQSKVVTDQLRCVLLDAAGDALSLACTDTFTRIEVTAPSDGMGKYLVEIDRLAQIVGKLPAGAVEIGDKDDAVIIKAGRSRLTIPMLPVGSFPEWPHESSAVAWQARGLDLADTLSAVQPAMHRDSAMGDLHGVYIDSCDGGGRAVATNGNRLHCSRFESDGLVPPLWKSLLSRDFVAALKAAADTDDWWTIMIGERSVVARGPAVTVYARLVEGEFPDYRALPSRDSFTVQWTVDADAFSSALRRCMIVAQDQADRAHAVRLAPIDDGLELSSQDQHGAAVVEEVPGAVSGGEAVSYNATYLIEAVRVLTQRGAKTITMLVNGKAHTMIDCEAVPSVYAFVFPLAR